MRKKHGGSAGGHTGAQCVVEHGFGLCRYLIADNGWNMVEHGFGLCSYPYKQIIDLSMDAECWWEDERTHPANVELG